VLAGEEAKLPSIMAIKHEIRTLMARDEIARAEADARAEASRGRHPGEREPLVK
jgi:hypothetical protein